MRSSPTCEPWPRRNPDKLRALDFAILAVEQIGLNAAAGRNTVVDPRLATILVDGVVELLTDWAAGEVDAERQRAAHLERALAGKPPAILH